MKTLSKIRSLLLGIGFFMGLGGCTLPISADLRQEANRKLNFTEVADNPSAYIGKTIIWGGLIQQVRKTSGGTEIQIMQTPLKEDESPDPETIGGEFIAIPGKVSNLNNLKKGKRITIAGEIVGERTEDTETAKFSYPVIYIKEFHLWDRGNKWWDPSSSSGWFWEIFGTSRQSFPDELEQRSWEQKVW